MPEFSDSRPTAADTSNVTATFRLVNIDGTIIEETVSASTSPGGDPSDFWTIARNQSFEDLNSIRSEIENASAGSVLDYTNRYFHVADASAFNAEGAIQINSDITIRGGYFSGGTLLTSWSFLRNDSSGRPIYEHDIDWDALWRNQLGNRDEISFYLEDNASDVMPSLSTAPVNREGLISEFYTLSRSPDWWTWDEDTDTSTSNMVILTENGDNDMSNANLLGIRINDPVIRSEVNAIIQADGLGVQMQWWTNGNHVNANQIHSWDNTTGELMLKYSVDTSYPTNGTHSSGFMFCLAGSLSFLEDELTRGYAYDIANNKLYYKPDYQNVPTQLRLSFVGKMFENNANLTIENAVLVNGGIQHTSGALIDANPGSQLTLTDTKMGICAKNVLRGEIPIQTLRYHQAWHFNKGLTSRDGAILRHSKFEHPEDTPAVMILCDTTLPANTPVNKTIVDGCIFHTPVATHAQGLSLYNDSWYNADVTNNIFVNNQRPFSYQIHAVASATNRVPDSDLESNFSNNIFWVDSEMIPYGDADGSLKGMNQSALSNNGKPDTDLEGAAGNVSVKIANNTFAVSDVDFNGSPLNTQRTLRSSQSAFLEDHWYSTVYLYNNIMGGARSPEVEEGTDKTPNFHSKNYIGDFVGDSAFDEVGTTDITTEVVGGFDRNSFSVSGSLLSSAADSGKVGVRYSNLNIPTGLVDAEVTEHLLSLPLDWSIAAQPQAVPAIPTGDLSEVIRGGDPDGGGGDGDGEGEPSDGSFTLDAPFDGLDRMIIDSRFALGEESAILVLSGTGTVGETVQLQDNTTGQWKDIAVVDSLGFWKTNDTDPSQDFYEASTVTIDRGYDLSGDWYKVRIRYASEPTGVLESENTFLPGFVFMSISQSERAQMFQHTKDEWPDGAFPVENDHNFQMVQHPSSNKFWYDAVDPATAVPLPNGEPGFTGPIGNSPAVSPDDDGFLWFAATPERFRIDNANSDSLENNKNTSVLRHMANMCNKVLPNIPVLFVDNQWSGTTRRSILANSNEFKRNSSGQVLTTVYRDFKFTTTVVDWCRQHGTEIGVVDDMWYAADKSRWRFDCAFSPLYTNTVILQEEFPDGINVSGTTADYVQGEFYEPGTNNTTDPDFQCWNCFFDARTGIEAHELGQGIFRKDRTRWALMATNWFSSSLLKTSHDGFWGSWENTPSSVIANKTPQYTIKSGIERYEWIQGDSTTPATILFDQLKDRVGGEQCERTRRCVFNMVNQPHNYFLLASFDPTVVCQGEFRKDGDGDGFFDVWADESHPCGNQAVSKLEDGDIDPNHPDLDLINDFGRAVDGQMKMNEYLVLSAARTSGERDIPIPIFVLDSITPNEAVFRAADFNGNPLPTGSSVQTLFSVRGEPDLADPNFDVRDTLDHPNYKQVVGFELEKVGDSFSYEGFDCVFGSDDMTVKILPHEPFQNGDRIRFNSGGCDNFHLWQSDCLHRIYRGMAILNIPGMSAEGVPFSAEPRTPIVTVEGL